VSCLYGDEVNLDFYGEFFSGLCCCFFAGELWFLLIFKLLSLSGDYSSILIPDLNLLDAFN
jgi:hypothetical protein